MLKSLRVSNYRSLGEDVSLEFGRFTALVGPNGSGKSNVVDTLRFVSDAMHMGLSGAVTHRSGIDAVRRWSGGHPFDLRIELDLVLGDGLEGHYGFVLTGARAEEYHVKSEEAWLVGDGAGVEFRIEEGRWIKGPSDLRPPLNRQGLALQLVGGDERFSQLVQSLKAMSVYSIFPDTLRVPHKYSPRKPMERHGENWISILKDQPVDTWKTELVSALDKLTGDTVDIRIEPTAGYLVVQFEHRTEKQKRKWFEAAQESDGTLRVAGIISALLQEPPVPVIGIEEPELTVHPGAISLLYDFLHQATKRSQVIITTHSPEMLEHVDVADVRVVERRDGVTSVSPMAWHQKEAVHNRLLSLGDLLRGPGIEQQGEDEEAEQRERPLTNVS